MKGNKKMITLLLNSLLADELTSIHQYMVHSKLCAGWGYSKLHEAIRKQTMDEILHAEWLIERIIFLDAAPIVSKINPLKIGKTVLEMINNDKVDELHSVRAYNEAIVFGRQVEDEGTVELLTRILKMEEDHVEWAEMQLAQVEQMGIENYLNNQTDDDVH